MDAIDRQYPHPLDDRAEPATAAGPDSPPARAWVAVPAAKTGYIQAVESSTLVDIACARDTVIRMERGVGEFVVADCPLVSVSGAPLDPGDIRRLNGAYAVGRERTVPQDPSYGIRQIVDIALKALSPAINDTTTAINCIDYLGAILVRLTSRRFTDPRRLADGRLRLIALGSSFRRTLGQAFDQIRENADGNVAVLIRLLETLEMIRGRVADPDRLLALRQQADLVAETAHRTVPSTDDRARIQAARGHDLSALTV